MSFEDLEDENIDGRNPLKSGQCFLPRMREGMAYKGSMVAIPSNRVNVSYRNGLMLHFHALPKRKVAIPSNRVNVSYMAERQVKPR